MALVHITLTLVRARVPDSIENAADTMESAGASAQSSIVAEGSPLLRSRYWTIVPKGDVWVSFGLNPTAAADSGHLVLANQPRSFAVSMAGEKVAVKDAA